MTSGPRALPKTLTLRHLIGLGLGAMIGSGIFLLTGVTAATEAGPAIIVSFLIAGIVSILAGRCYAEVVLEQPSAGAAYTVATRYFGPFVGWLTGCLMLLEYGSASAVLAEGVSQYLGDAWGIRQLHHAAGVDLVPALCVAIMAYMLSRGAKRGHTWNAVAVATKVIAVGVILILGMRYTSLRGMHPFVPPQEMGADGHHHFGWQGIVVGASMIFCALCGQESITSAVEECRNPGRDIRKALTWSVVVAAAIYILVTVTMVDMLPYRQLNSPHALVDAFVARGDHLAAPLIRAAGTLGMMTVIYACLNASSRTIFALARDGHLPGSLTTVNPRTHSPDACVWLIAGFAALAATLTPVMQLAQLINVGTLGAFSCVALAALRPGPSGQRPFAMRIVAITSLLCTSALLTLLLYHVWRGALIFIGAASLIFGLRWIRRTAAVTP